MTTTHPWQQGPLENRRRPGLGRYTGTRQEWVKAWREARTHHKDPENSDAHRAGGLLWKACLTLWFERACDTLRCTPAQQLAANRLIDEILQENINAERRNRQNTSARKWHT